MPDDLEISAHNDRDTLRGSLKVIRPRSFTLVELMIVIAIISVLAGMLLPALKSGMDLAQRINCGNNQKQLLQALTQYCNDHKGWYPEQGFNATQWGSLHPTTAPIWNYIDRSISDCPTIEKNSRSDFIKTAIICGGSTDWQTTAFPYQGRLTVRRQGRYEAVVAHGPQATSTQRPLTTDLFNGHGALAEAGTGYSWIQTSSRGTPNQDAGHNGEGVNTGFEDGHVGWVINPLGAVPLSYAECALTEFWRIDWQATHLIGWKE